LIDTEFNPKLVALGVERYHVDFVKGSYVFYTPTQGYDIPFAWEKTLVVADVLDEKVGREVLIGFFGKVVDFHTLLIKGTEAGIALSINFPREQKSIMLGRHGDSWLIGAWKY